MKKHPAVVLIGFAFVLLIIGNLVVVQGFIKQSKTWSCFGCFTLWTAGILFGIGYAKYPL